MILANMAEDVATIMVLPTCSGDSMINTVSASRRHGHGVFGHGKEAEKRVPFDSWKEGDGEVGAVGVLIGGGGFAEGERAWCEWR